MSLFYGLLRCCGIANPGARKVPSAAILHYAFIRAMT